MRYTYEISPRPESLGGGWRLRLQDHGNEVGGGIFAAPVASPEQVAEWWAGLADAERVEWLDRSGGMTPADAHHAFRRAEAYAAAEAAALAWLRGHGVPLGGQPSPGE